MNITITDPDGLEALRQHLSSSEEIPPTTLSVGDGHSGFGVYMWTTEYPEEGSVLLQAMPEQGTVRLAAPANWPRLQKRGG